MRRPYRRLAVVIAGFVALFARGAAGSEFTRGTLIKAGGDNVNAIAFSPDGKILATGHNSEAIKLWSLPEGRETATLKGHKASVLSLAFSPDGKTRHPGS